MTNERAALVAAMEEAFGNALRSGDGTHDAFWAAADVAIKHFAGLASPAVPEPSTGSLPGGEASPTNEREAGSR